MKLPNLAIENHQFTLVMVLLLTLMGVVSFFSMPRSEDPQYDAPWVSVVAVYPGTGAVDLEQLIVDPLEEALGELEDLKKVSTSIQDGVAVLWVNLASGSDPEEKYNELAEHVAALRGDLPASLLALRVAQSSPKDANIVQVALVSETASYRTMQRHAERLEHLLERLPGVKRADTWAFPEEQVRVAIDLEKLHETNLTLGQVTQAIQSSSENLPGGTLDVGTRRFNMQTSGGYTSLDDLRRTVVFARAERVVYLKDVADVGWAYADDTYRARYNGRRAVFVTVQQHESANIFHLMEAVDARLDAFTETLPADLSLHYVFDQSKGVKTRVNGFFLNLLQGVLLVGLVVLLGLGLRASLIVMLAIPLSIFIAIGWVDLSGYGLQQISIVGLVIALGLLVDNAIVVTENVRRFREQGLSDFQAAVRGTSQVGWALVSSTATTVLAFVPMVLLQTETGTFIRSMPVTVIYALTASLLISLALTPYLASRFLKKPPGLPPASEEHAQQGGALQPLLNRMVEGPYHRALRFALARPAVVIVSAVLLFAGSLALFPLVGVSLFPKAEKPLLLIDIDLPEGSSLNKTDAVARYVESILDGRDEIVHYASNVGHGNPRIYYNAIPKSETPTHAQVLLALKTYCPKTMAALVQDLRAVFDVYPGADIKVREFQQGPGVEAPIAIKILGDDLGVLHDLAGQVETLVAQMPGTLHVENPTRKRKTDLRLNINRDKASLFGLPLVEVDRTVLASMAGMRVAGFRNQEGNAYDVVVRLPIDGPPSVADLDRISVASVTGAQVPLRQVASVEFAAVPKRIEHYNFERSVTVTADVQDGYNVATVTRQITEGLNADHWPTGYRYVIGGEQENREESFGGMEQALLVALFGIFGVLVLQFRSFLQPLIVFTAIPFAISGAILALLVTEHTFSFVAFVGLTSLVGIVVNNSIILVDYANQLRRGGRSVVEAVREAGETRFTPILLTTLTTIGALLPLTLQGSALWSPFGWAIIGGLLVSTFLTLILVPVLYKLLTRPRVSDTSLSTQT